jgi:hypothetical protein
LETLEIGRCDISVLQPLTFEKERMEKGVSDSKVALWMHQASCQVTTDDDDNDDDDDMNDNDDDDDDDDKNDDEDDKNDNADDNNDNDD